MHFLPILASLGLLFTGITANPIESRAASSVALKIQSQKGTSKYSGVFLSFQAAGGAGTNVINLSPTGGKSAASAQRFTVSGGSLHTTVPSNKVIKSGPYSTRSIIFGDYVQLQPGKGTNDYVIVNKTSGRLTFKPQPGSPSENAFNLCSKGSAGYLLALGTTDSACTPVFVKTVPL